MKRRRRARDVVDLLRDAGFVAYPLGHDWVVALRYDEHPRLIAVNGSADWRLLVLAARMAGAIPVIAEWPRREPVPVWRVL